MHTLPRGECTPNMQLRDGPQLQGRMSLGMARAGSAQPPPIPPSTPPSFAGRRTPPRARAGSAHPPLFLSSLLRGP
eukprot:257138-Chlamydomonas_euryale.AAC.5